MRSDEAALVERRQQVLHGDQRQRFALGEPQARQFELAALPVLLVVAVAPLVGIPYDGRAEAVAHVFEVALERGERYFQFAQEVVAADDSALLQQRVDLVEALEPVQRQRRMRR